MADDSPANQSANFDDLKMPDMSLRGLMGHFGPGIILMMTGIGTSHLITAPSAGGRFEFALLWCIPVAYIFKYYGFEMAFRFTNATGRSMIEAYSTAWKKWPLWYVLVTTLIQCAIGQAGRLIAAAAVLYYIFTVSAGLPISLPVYGLILGVVSVTIILRGNYKALENVTKFLAAILVVSTFAVYFMEPAPLSEMGHFFLVEIPDGSWLIIAAFLGLLPTGIDVSLQASEWGKAKKKGMCNIRERLETAGLVEKFDPFAPDVNALTVDTSKLPENAVEYSQHWFKIGMWDFRLGHVVSFILACIFLLLAAVWIYPKPGGRTCRDGANRRHLHRKHRTGNDDRVYAGRVRCHFFDRIQLFRWLAQNCRRLLPQSISAHGIPRRRGFGRFDACPPQHLVFRV